MDKEDKSFMQGFILGILCMSQIAGILGHAGYEIPKEITITEYIRKVL